MCTEGHFFGKEAGLRVKVSTYCHPDQGRLLQVCVLRPIKMAENTVTRELLDNAFYVLQLDDKLRTKTRGGPPSLLSILITHNNTNSDRRTNIFASLSKNSLIG